MKHFAILVPVILTFFVGQRTRAQEAAPNQPAAQRPSEPGTAEPRIAPANKAPKPVQQPDVRLDSKPHTDIDYTVDSSREGMDLGLGANPEIDLGSDILPTTPPGMIGRSVEDNPRIVYFALPHRSEDSSGDTIAPHDAELIAARQGDLVRAAAFHAYDLHLAGWQYQQGVCPATEPNAERVVGVPAPGEGSILLHFIRRSKNKDFAFTALVPRDPVEPVRVIANTHGSVESGSNTLLAKTSGATVNRALPPSTLYKNLQPVQGWIAASACIAEMAGAYPHIPNEPFLSEDIVTAPPPLIHLKLDGSRETLFTDRVDEKHYVVWNESVSNHGRMLAAHHEVVPIVQRPVTNPPTPKPRMLTDIPEARTRIGPEPPSPLAGSKQ